MVRSEVWFRSSVKRSEKGEEKKKKVFRSRRSVKGSKPACMCCLATSYMYDFIRAGACHRSMISMAFDSCPIRQDHQRSMCAFALCLVTTGDVRALQGMYCLYYGDSANDIKSRKQLWDFRSNPVPILDALPHVLPSPYSLLLKTYSDIGTGPSTV